MQDAKQAKEEVNQNNLTMINTMEDVIIVENHQQATSEMTLKKVIKNKREKKIESKLLTGRK